MRWSIVSGRHLACPWLEPARDTHMEASVGLRGRPYPGGWDWNQWAGVPRRLVIVICFYTPGLL